jgi:serine protease Do
MSESPSTKFIALVTIVAAPFALGAFMLAWAPAQQFSNTDPARDGYVAPRSISDLVEKIQTSTVTVICEPSEKGFGQGTGWEI